MDELSKRIGYDKRTVRQLIFNARCNGELICSTCDGEYGGYYRPTSPNEAYPFYQMQKSRIESAYKALQAVSDYIGVGSVEND